MTRVIRMMRTMSTTKGGSYDSNNNTGTSNIAIIFIIYKNIIFYQYCVNSSYLNNIFIIIFIKIFLIINFKMSKQVFTSENRRNSMG